jgi:hypothetical protein
MDWLSSVSVASATSQPILLSFRTRPETEPGNYTGTLALTDGSISLVVKAILILHPFYFCWILLSAILSVKYARWRGSDFNVYV